MSTLSPVSSTHSLAPPLRPKVGARRASTFGGVPAGGAQGRPSLSVQTGTGVLGGNASANGSPNGGGVPSPLGSLGPSLSSTGLHMGQSSGALSPGVVRGRIGRRSAAAFHGEVDPYGPQVGLAANGSYNTNTNNNNGINNNSRGMRVMKALGRHGGVFRGDLGIRPELLGASLHLDGSDSAVHVGAAVVACYAFVLAFAAHALVLALVLRSLPVAFLWAAAALALLAALLLFRLRNDFSLFVLSVLFVFDVAVVFAMLLGHAFLCVWMTPAVLYTNMFIKQNAEWVTLWHLVLTSGTYVLLHYGVSFDVDGISVDDFDFDAFITFTIVFLLFLSGLMVRFIFYQISIQKENLEQINFHLKMQNRTLQSELRELRSLETEDVLGTPAEKVIQMLRSLAGDPKNGLSEIQKADIHHIIRLIGSNKLYVSSVSYSAIRPSENVDTETQKWVLDQLVQQEIEPQEETKIATIEEEPITEPDTTQKGSLSKPVAEFGRGGKRGSYVDLRKPSIFNISMDKMTDRLLEVLGGIDNWNFDIFEFDKLADRQALAFLGLHLFEKYDFITEFDIPEPTLKRFLYQIQSGYINNPYHNALHAGDVLQSFNSLIASGGLSKCELNSLPLRVLEPVEIFSCLLATIIHDYRHPGVNNNFLMSVEDSIAITFNDTSVLENFHVSEAFKLMSSDEFNILKNVPKDVKKKIRKITIDLVLATDMSRHADIMGALKNSISVGALTGDSFDSRMLMMKMAMKISDVSNPAKPSHVAQEWTKRVTQEFYCQGDKEREKGLPISPFMDRGVPMISKAQIGFISFVVQPLVELWNSAMGTGLDSLQNLSLNLEYWKTRMDEDNIQQQMGLNEPTAPPAASATVEVTAPSPSPSLPPPPILNIPIIQTEHVSDS